MRVLKTGKIGKELLKFAPVAIASTITAPVNEM
jgi:hypothetical protein